LAVNAAINTGASANTAEYLMATASPANAPAAAIQASVRFS
jgi:hypothetical protein